MIEFQNLTLIRVKRHFGIEGISWENFRLGKFLEKVLHFPTGIDIEIEYCKLSYELSNFGKTASHRPKQIVKKNYVFRFKIIRIQNIKRSPFQSTPFRTTLNLKHICVSLFHRKPISLFHLNISPTSPHFIRIVPYGYLFSIIAILFKIQSEITRNPRVEAHVEIMHTAFIPTININAFSIENRTTTTV